MKLLHSFVKELILASRSFYFYIEIGMALVVMLILLFVVPENFDSKKVEYVHWHDLPQVVESEFRDSLIEGDLDHKGEDVWLKYEGKETEATLFETDDTKMYVLGSKEDVIGLSKDKKKFGTVINYEDNNLSYVYYLQGYESDRLKNIYLVFHNKDVDILEEKFDNQNLVMMSEDYDQFTDRENVLPAFIALNGGMFGLFIIAAYVFLDKQEGMIKAYAVTSSPVWQYLLSKVGVLVVSSAISTAIVTVPIMGFSPNYGLILILLIATSFFASALGLLLASFYDNIMQAFGAIFVVMIILMLPTISYFMPSWDAKWVQWIPTYTMIEGFKESLLNGDSNYVLMASLGFLVSGTVLFLLANYRYKKTLTV